MIKSFYEHLGDIAENPRVVEFIESKLAARKTIGQWEEIKGVKILDPDGFDRTDERLFERLFTEQEFEQRLFTSTIEGRNCQKK